MVAMVGVEYQNTRLQKKEILVITNTSDGEWVKNEFAFLQLDFKRFIPREEIMQAIIAIQPNRSAEELQTEWEAQAKDGKIHDYLFVPDPNL